jgi:hypothetical protein
MRHLDCCCWATLSAKATYAICTVRADTLVLVIRSSPGQEVGSEASFVQAAAPGAHPEAELASVVGRQEGVEADDSALRVGGCRKMSAQQR